MSRSKSFIAFTLIELIIVIAIIAILAAAIFVAIDPARRLHESRNARRWGDVTSILSAVVKCQADNGGTHCGDVNGLTAGTYYMLGAGNSVSGCAASAVSSGTVCGGGAGTGNCVDLTTLGSNYIGTNPADPLDGTSDLTRYWLTIDNNGAVTVGSCDAEGEGAGGAGASPDIELTR